MNDGWIEMPEGGWPGNVSPVQGEMVDIRRLNGTVEYSKEWVIIAGGPNTGDTDASDLYFNFTGYCKDIVAYRLHKPETNFIPVTSSPNFLEETEDMRRFVAPDLTCGNSAVSPFAPKHDNKFMSEALAKAMRDAANPEWVEVKTIDEMELLYHAVMPAIRAAAKQCGYAIGLHGSMRRDLDLIAVPWIEEHADKDTLARAIHKAACGFTQSKYNWEAKPNGRTAASFPICWTSWHGMVSAGHIDLSVALVVEHGFLTISDALVSLPPGFKFELLGDQFAGVEYEAATIRVPRAEYEAMKADKERLDWLDKRNGYIEVETNHGVYFFPSTPAREIIDAAREAS